MFEFLRVNCRTNVELYENNFDPYCSCEIFLKENVRNFRKLKQNKYLIKYYIIQKSSLKITFLMFLANFIFVVSYLKIHPAVHLNTWKALTSW